MKKLHKEKLNKKEKAIVTKAFILRYGIFIALIFSDSLIKMSVCILCYGIIFLISALIECEEFYCAMMDIYRKHMKPYKYSSEWRKKFIKKEYRFQYYLL